MLLPVAGAVSLFVFFCTLMHDRGSDEYEWFEQTARILGYVLTLAAALFSWRNACRIRQSGIPGRADTLTLATVLTTLIFLLAHDVLLYDTYGNQLEGVYPMTVFFALDAGLLFAYVLLALQKKKRPAHRAAQWLWLAAALLWACYIVGDCAGYPVSHIYDWDEALIKAIPMCDAVMHLLFAANGKKENLFSA